MKKLLLFALLLPALAQAQIVKPGKPGTGGGGGSATPVVNNLNQSTTGSALDAVQGKALATLIAGKLSIGDTNVFLRKISGWRLISPTEINKLANTSGTNTGDQTLSLSGSQLTLSGGGGTVNLPSGGGSATPLTNNLTTTTTGTALDAAQGKVVSDSITAHRNRIAANAIAITGKLSIGDTNSLVRKVSGYRLLTPAEITKLANQSGTNTGDQTISISGSRITLSGNGGFVDVPSSGGGGTLPISYLASPSEFATLTTTYAFYDGSVWLRASGSVDSNPDNNPKYTALQYNAGSFHYDRQYTGYAMFSWWRNSSGNTWQQMKYAINHQAGAKIQVEDGTYTFTENVYSPGNFEVRGNLLDPKRCVLRVTGTETRLFRGWFWYDGVTAGQLFENIKIHGFTFDEASTGTNSEANNNGSYGPICFEGGSSQNISITDNIFLHSSTTARVNGIFIKAGANKLVSKIEVKRNRANVGSTSVPINPKARIFCEIINQDHPNNDQVTGQDVVVSENDISGWDMGISVAGNFDKTLNENNKIGNTGSYCIETAGTNTNAVIRNNRFYGVNNVLWASNYHGENGTARGDYPIPPGTGQSFVGNRTLGYTTGILEVRGGGDLTFANNDLNISGGLYMRRNSLGGVVKVDLKNNRIVSDASASNMTNKAIVFLAGALNVRATGNTFERTSTDTQPMIQAAQSGAEDGATGTASTGSQFINNFLYSGAGVLSSYFSATSPNSLSQGYNFNATGLINN